MRHICADHPAIPVVHVTHFNDLFWDCGSTRTTVIEHGVVDPGYRYTGELERLAAAINEPQRRGRVTGSDLLQRFAEVAPVDLFGMQVTPMADPPWIVAHEDPPQAVLHDELPRRRVYVHPIRWTSLGLSLLEAMHLGMPVVALATTEVVAAVPAGAGVVATDVNVLTEAARQYVKEPERAVADGRRARQAALERYGLERFLREWDLLLEEVGR
jgi:glycosyltransferase involved in cell wall biosynthesis